MKAEKDRVVSIIYDLRKGSSTGEIVESLNESNPLTFLFGSGGLLPKFEEQLEGLNAGDPFQFLMNSEDAYGPVIDSAVVPVPKNIFIIDGQIDYNILQVGNTIPMMDGEGRRLNGVVTEIQDEVVIMDFNHPMAGSDLHFTGRITEVREASEEELSHGHVHGNHNCDSCDGEHGHHHGDSCSCGGH
ncbi:MAG: FKBP-type peptidyl-prolyl cis-trans isomerase [Bacteroidota bacterium]